MSAINCPPDEVYHLLDCILQLTDINGTDMPYESSELALGGMINIEYC